MKRVLPLILVAAAYVAASLIWIANDRRIARKTFETFSAENTSDSGYSLAMKYLARSGRRNVNMLTTSPDATLPANAVVFRAIEGKMAFSLKDLLKGQHEDDDDSEEATKEKPAPKKKAKPKYKHVEPLLSNDEDAFVRNGGRFVIAVGGYYDVNLATRNETAKKAVKVFPAWPGIDEIALPVSRTLQAPDVLRRAHALYVIGDQPALAGMTIGKGEVILIAAPELFDNAHIAQHLDLLTALAGNRRTIYFDEAVHGLLTDTGTLDLLRRWRLGPALVLLLIIAVVTIWRGARGVGKAEDDYRETRSDAIDLVSSLGALYDESMSRAEAIALYYQALTQSVAAQTGLRGEQLHKRIATLTNDMQCGAGPLTRPGGLENPPHVENPPQEKPRDIDPEEFKKMLTALNDAFRRI